MEKKNDPLIDAINQGVESASPSNLNCTLTFEEFFREYPIAPDYQWGSHTRYLLKRLGEASEAVSRGECRHIIINVPPRHGKSDICSRRFPAYHLCKAPDHEVMLATYAAALSEDLSHNTRQCFAEAGPRFGLKLSDDRNQIGAWRIEGKRGGMFAIGIGGTVTGRGANILVIDDYCKNRQEAESEDIRNSTWDAFRSDLLTRLAPAHAVIIVATRWHEDDLVGRILNEMERGDPNFPKFEVINFPAQAEDGSYLFPERFSSKWYETMRGAVGTYAWESLYQGNPKPRTGRLLRADLVEIIDELPSGLTFVRSWDLASTDKERIKDDPDYTVGTKLAFDGEYLYIADVVRMQSSAPQRDKKIIDTAEADGRAVQVRIESVAGYKDTYMNVRAALSGKAIVRPVKVTEGDKVARAAVLEPVFEGGKVRILRAPWNGAWLAEFSAFPKGKHDDQVDSCTNGATELLSAKRRMKLSS